MKSCVAGCPCVFVQESGEANKVVEKVVAFEMDVDCKVSGFNS